ncbi:MAG: NAD(P)/FAD-dependent oxidoreductase [Pikeienuella sp.]
MSLPNHRRRRTYCRVQETLLTDHRSMPESSKHILVVGAGIVGVSTAIWAQRAGANVTLIDRVGPAAGTSFGNAGLLAAASVVPVTTPGLMGKAPGMLFNPDKPLFLRWSYLPRLLPFLRRYLAHANADAVERISVALTVLLADTAEQHLSLARGTAAESYISVGDYLFGYGNRSDFDADAFAWGVRERRGFEYEVLEGRALRAYDPALPHSIGLAARCPDHGWISDPGKYVNALAQHLTDEGGRFLTATLEDIALENGKAVAAITSAGRIEADEVIVTTGAWSGPLAKRLGVTMPLETERGYHLEFVNPSVTLKVPTMITAGKFVVTPMAGRMRCAGVVEFGGLDAAPSRAPFELLRRQTLKHFPDLTFDSVNEWMGHRPATTDSLPVIGASPNAANVWFGYGHQHIGLTAGPKTGRWLAQMALGQPPNIDLSAFAADRPAGMQG